ncbi:high-potential iron-sulfur protein [Cupriavidus necator]|uniref:high-potential iron-sulfur protein n=1 Tax=Cupriavidus necator TaxID=106590 RepID=UPI0009B89B96|nr:high-potential iron-sulfur protein [Cupriavidus necator]
MTTRRTFLKGISGLVAAAVGGIESPANAQAGKLDENDPQAVSLGYKHETTKVDKAKFPKHEASQKCSNCQLFQGKASDAWGPCPIFGSKQVAANGWCNSYVKKV